MDRTARQIFGGKTGRCDDAASVPPDRAKGRLDELRPKGDRQLVVASPRCWKILLMI